MADRVENPSLQEVEVESMPTIEFVEDEQVGVVEEMIEGQQMVPFHHDSDHIHEEIVLQPQEEIVGEDQSVLVGDDGLVYIDSIPVPAPDIDLSAASRSHKRRKSPTKRQTGVKNQVVVTSPDQLYSGGASAASSTSSEKKWEQKQFQIKTTDGEFSVTMWASGWSHCLYAVY